VINLETNMSNTPSHFPVNPLATRQALLLALALGLLLGLAAPLTAAEPEARAAKPSLLERWFGGKEDLNAYRQDADFALYQQACGGCHLAYSPWLLPGSSWQRIMGGLGDHFGQNVPLNDASIMRLQTYLLRHAAEKSNAPYANRLARTADYKPANIRLTETDYFSAKHKDIPPAQASQLSQCQTCHSQAEQGSYAKAELISPEPPRDSKAKD
jgi:hypothetical protein